MDFDEDWQDDEEAPADMPGFDDDAKDDVCNWTIPLKDMIKEAFVPNCLVSFTK